VLFLGIFFFSSRRKEKKRKEKKNDKEEKKCREGKEVTFKLLLYPFIFSSYFCLLASALSFQAFSPDIFFFSNRRKKKKNTKKKKHREKKKCRKGRELTFLLSRLHLG